MSPSSLLPLIPRDGNLYGELLVGGYYWEHVKQVLADAYPEMPFFREKLVHTSIYLWKYPRKKCWRFTFAEDCVPNIVHEQLYVSVYWLRWEWQKQVYSMHNHPRNFYERRNEFIRGRMKAHGQ